MPVNTPKASYDTYSDQSTPTANKADSRRLVLRADAGSTRHGYVYFGGMPPPGATVLSGELRLWLKGSGWAAGPHTITAKRCTSSWKESRLTYNRAPTVTSTNQATAAVTGGVDGQQVTLDVSAMLADVAAGQAWYGVRLEVSTTGADRNLHSSETPDPDLRPQLAVEWSRPPLPPADLSPAGGRSVSTPAPVLTWTFKDREGDAQQAYQVQIDTTSTVDAGGALVTPEYDSGWVTSTDEQHDLDATAYGGVPEAATRYWTARTRDVHGLVSDWADVVSFRRDFKGALTISTPADGGTVEETTPPVTTTLASRAQDSISYRLEEDAGGGVWTERWELGRHDAPAAAGVAHSFAVPAGTITKTGTDYRLTVRVWDAITREGTPGDPTYVEAVSTFTFVRSATPAPVTALGVAAENPGVLLTWTRTLTPDYFALMVDGERVLDRIDPATFAQGGGAYACVYYGADPREAHTFEVEAVVIDLGKLKHSQGNATAAHTPEPTGIWLVDDHDPPHHPDNLPRRVRIRGDSQANLGIGESATTYYVIGRRDPVRIVDAVRGLEGEVSGVVRADDPTGSDYIENLRWLKHPSRVGRRFRLILGGESIRVELTDVAFAPTPNPGAREYAVTVGVIQVSDFR